MKSSIILLILLFAVSCKTAEDIQREQMIEQMSVQLIATQKLAADLTVRVGELEGQLQQLTGKMEEGDRQKEVQMKEELASLQQNVKSIEEQYKNKQITLEKKVEEQNKYIKGINKVISSAQKSKNSSKMARYKSVMKMFDKKQYQKAESILLDLYKNTRLTANQNARILHNLGFINYKRKDFDEATTFYSKVIVKYPQSSYWENSLLYLGYIFRDQNQKDQAIQAFERLVEKSPNSWHGKQAKKQLNKLK